MNSILLYEPASPGVVLIAERSDQVEEQGSTITFYRGAFTRVGPQWKPGPSSAGNIVGTIDRNISDTVFHSVEAIFANKLSSIGGIERILIRKDSDFFRAWVVIADANIDLEDQIYDAQLAFMDQFPDIPFDFTVIFRRGKSPGSIQPSRAHQIYP